MKANLRRRPNSGSVIFTLVMAVLLILGILGFSLYRSMTEKANFVNAHTNAAMLDFAAIEIGAVIFDELGKQLKNPAGDIFKKLLQAATDTTELKISGYDSLWEKKFSFLGKKEFARLSWSSTVKFTEFSGLSGTGKWNDPLEKKCRVTVDLDLSIGHVASRKLRKLYLFSRPCKIQRLSLPVVSKFSLFVKNPEKTQGITDGYNCFENMHDGNPTHANDSSPVKSLPLVLFNSPKLKLADITKAGYVFLGGNDELELHTTGGGHPEYGESFLFCSMGKPISSIVLYDLSSLPSTTGFAAGGVNLCEDPLLKGVLGIRVAVFGFYAVNNLGETMNYMDSLSRWFDPSNAITMSSSFLHLYGSLANPSPTLVIGRVKRAYARFSKLGVKLENRADFQGLCWLKNPAPMQKSSGQKVETWDMVTFPGTFDDRKTGKSYSLATESLTMPTLFGNPKDPSGAWNAYMDRASGIYSEEYNRIYDYLFRKDEDKEFPPSESSFEKKFGPYLQTGESFSFSRTDPKTALFQGDLNKITSDDLVKDRITIQVKDRKEFEEWFKQSDGTFDLRGQVVKIGDGGLEIPAGAKFVTSGMLVVPGDITVKGALACDEKAVVTLVSLGKDILLQGTNEEIQAHLVALDGTVKSAAKSTLKIKGGMAVKSLSPKDWKAGGTVTYDDRLDPTQTGQESMYAAYIADYHDRWKVEQVLK